MSRKSRRRPGSRQSGRHPRLEWIGGLVRAPVRIADAPGEVHMVFWLERPGGQVVGHALVPGDARAAESSVLDVLRESLRQPLDGPRRTPERLRVASEALGRLVRQGLGGRIPVLVAPTPELDNLARQMAEDLGWENRRARSYLEGTDLTPEIVSDLFNAAALLFRVAPWKYLGEDPPFRIDLPALGIRGGCLVIVGESGEAAGIALFPSLEAFRRFPEPPPDGPHGPGGPATPGSTADGGPTVLLTFFNRDDLPPAMVAEVQQHGWALADPELAYPIVHGGAADKAPALPSARDVQLLTLLIPALVQFLQGHLESMAHDPWATPGTTLLAPVGIQIRITYPYESFHTFDWAPDEPCPCGSGRTYASCCASPQATHRRPPAPGTPRAVFDELDAEYFAAVAHFMDARTPPPPDPWHGVFRSWHRAVSLANPWAIHHGEVDGLPPREHYRRANGERLDAKALEWFDAEAGAWLGVWAVVADETSAGSVTLVDQLSGERARIAEASVPGWFSPEDHVLARLVRFRGEDILDGHHHHLLSPEAARPVIERTLKHLRRRAPVPVDRLRSAAFTKYLIRRWEEAAGD